MDAIVNGKVPLPRVRRPDLPNELSIDHHARAVDRSERAGSRPPTSCASRSISSRSRREPHRDDVRARDVHAQDVRREARAVARRTAPRQDRRDRRRWPTEPRRPPRARQLSAMDRRARSLRRAEEEASTDAASTGTTPRASRKRCASSARRDSVAPPTRMRLRRLAKRDAHEHGLGWERAAMPPAPRGATRARCGSPFRCSRSPGSRVWQLALKPQQATEGGRRDPAQAAAPTPPMAPQPRRSRRPHPAPTVEPDATPEPPAVRVAGPEPVAPAADARRAAARAGDGGRRPTPVPADREEDSRGAHAARTDAQAPAPVVAVAAPAPVLRPRQPRPPPPVPRTPPPAPVHRCPPSRTPEPPKEIEIDDPEAVERDGRRRSRPTTARVSSRKCEGGAELHGDIAVSFQIDGDGQGRQEPAVVEHQESEGRRLHPEGGAELEVPEAAARAPRRASTASRISERVE